MPKPGTKRQQVSRDSEMCADDTASHTWYRQASPAHFGGGTRQQILPTGGGNTVSEAADGDAIGGVGSPPGLGGAGKNGGEGGGRGRQRTYIAPRHRGGARRHNRGHFDCRAKCSRKAWRSLTHRARPDRHHPHRLAFPHGRTGTCGAAKSAEGPPEMAMSSERWQSSIAREYGDSRMRRGGGTARAGRGYLRQSGMEFPWQSISLM